ncbi:hypothetical protein H9Q13_12710 [Pontibacter sp. JH31]|uniref:Uncharacterized protein n=1 Tax=Pontibacter aquaedesilientis TaxID=2766980 RepID=A0ABR7XIE3_9BACT|nr:hypothetical protein [Pontibacter aquaedesilientis]MBD1398031.1 hypothetical protein [Pontibacter aquaedesilientis]
MEDKYNQLRLERYSKELANLLCDRHFAAHDTINGPQLIGFTPIKQINLFVIKELLLKWHHEMANLRSPYFDYEHEEVKEALLNFMNVLSRKILIKRDAFEPLLQKAIYDTFLLKLAPAATFEEKFLRIQEEITLPKLQENLKYIDLDKALFSGFVGTLSPSNRDRDYILSRFRLYLNANKESIAPLSELVATFNSLLPITEEEICQAAPQAPSLAAYAAKPTPAAPVEEKDVVAPIHMAQREASAPVAAATRPAAVADSNLNERFRAERPTMNEKFSKPVSSSVADSLSNRKIESLKNSISINQRFSFINELFDGDNMTYYHTIQKLDEYNNPDEARHFVLHELSHKYDWSKKQENVSKLIRLIERKFA